MNISQLAQTLANALIYQLIPAIVASIGLLLFGSFGLRIIVRLVGTAARRGRVKPALVDLLTATLTAVGWILIIAGILQSVGLNQIALALGGSISLVALGIATAASGNLGDIIAGVFLASDPDFGPGFIITTAQISGTIEHIDLRKTRVRGPDGKLHIIPNKMIETNEWTVDGRPDAQPPIIFRRGRPQPPVNPANPNLAAPNVPPTPPRS